MKHLILPFFILFGILTSKAQNNNPINDPLRLFAYNDFLTEGTEYDISLQSSNFNNILSFQAGFRLKDADFVNASNGVLEIGNSYFYITQEKALRTLWFEQSAMPTTVTSDKPLIKLKIKPSKSGLLSEFIKLDTTVMMSEASYFNSNVTESILLEFNFPNRPTSTQELVNADATFLVFPNPSRGQNLNIKWLPTFQPQRVFIYDILGRNVLINTILSPESGELNIDLKETLGSGMYKVVLQNDKSTVSKTWIINKE